MKRYEKMTRVELIDALRAAERKNARAAPALRASVALQQELKRRCLELKCRDRVLHKTLRATEAVRDDFIHAHDYAPVAYVTLNSRGAIKHINLAGARMLGVAASALRGLTFTSFVEHSASKAFARHLTLVRKTQQITSSEILLSDKVPDGPRHVQFVSLPARDAGTRGWLFRTVMLDIPTRKRTEESLAGSEARSRELTRVIAERKEIETRANEAQNRFRQFAENIREVLWMTDLKTRRMIYLSPGYQKLWGRTSFYQSPQEWLSLIVPEDRERVWEAAQTKQVTGEYSLVYRLRRPDGSIRWIHERAFPVRDESGEVHRIAGIADDITERKLIEKELIEISDREQCRFGQDLHDGLCQHLAGIEYLTQSLKASLADNGHAEADQAAQIAMLIGQASAHAHDLARGLSPVPLEAGGLTSALQELVATTERLFHVRCELRSDGTVLIHDNAVATHLYRIAQEAVSNAIKHGKARRIVVSLAQDRHWTILSIKNDGAELPDNRPGHAGLGGRIMNFRAGMIGGVIELQHAPDRQPMVVCSIHNTFSPPAQKKKPLTAPTP